MPPGDGGGYCRGGDGVKAGGHFRGAVFDHSLQVAPFCTLHGMMGILAYKRGPVGGLERGICN